MNSPEGIVNSIFDCIGQTPIVNISQLFAAKNKKVYAKLEFMNPSGSMKDRPARFMIEEGIRTGKINKDTHLIESTSGNLGIAIALLAKRYLLNFTCVVDPKTTTTNLRILKELGVNLVMVDEPDDQGGYLKNRIKKVHELKSILPNSYWLNQYANENNWRAHYYGTAYEIVKQIDEPIDYLIAAVSTSGTLMGCAAKIKETSPHVKVIAVDAVGSVIFGADSRSRELPGIGSSRVPEILKYEQVDDVIYVNDKESIQGCRKLLEKEGIFAGGSSGSVVAAIEKYIHQIPKDALVATIFPDRGDRYLDTVYCEEWCAKVEATSNF